MVTVLYPNMCYDEVCYKEIDCTYSIIIPGVWKYYARLPFIQDKLKNYLLVLRQV